MSQTAEKRPLTADDPVEPETLDQFRRLQEARSKFANNLLSLEQEKIQLLAAVKKIDDQSSRLFEACLVERGLAPDTGVEIDPRTGKITRLADGNPQPVAKPVKADS